MRRRVFAAALAIPVAAWTACSEPPPPCTSETIDPACATAYVPTFNNVYTNTLRMDCGYDKGSCHSASGASGLSFADLDTAYAGLLDGYVSPGDPACSELIVRTHGVGKDYQMPKGTPLGATERCALVRWVSAGAPGPGQPLPMMMMGAGP